MWLSIILIFALMNVGKSEYPQPDGPCNSVFESEGTCSVLQDCEEIFTMLKSSSRAFLPAIHDILRESHCGFDGFRPKICCPLSSSTSSSTTVTQRPIEQNTIPTDTSQNNPFAPPDVTRHPNLNLLPVKCGDDDADRITIGEKTSVMQYPWMALVAYSSASGLRFRCGGSIINSRFILTAAHCVTDLRDMVLAGIRVGEHNIDTDRDCEGPVGDQQCASPIQDFLIDGVFSHPNYNVPRFRNDIALVKLGQSIDFTKNNVYPICLPFTAELRNLKLEGLTVKIAGWGITENNTDSNVLLQARIPVITNPECVEAYKPYLPLDTISYKQVCAGGSNGTDSCKGDSGGPMMIAGNVNNVVRHVQHGIISYGFSICGTVGIPGVYTRVAYYMDWILDQLQN